MHRRVIVAAVIVPVILAYLGAIRALRDLQSTASSTPDFDVHPLGGATLVAVYAGLGGVVVGLQFGVRSITDGATGQDAASRARTLIQRGFFSTLALASLLASVLLGYLSVFWFSGFPHIDAARTLGPLAASAFLAYVAAETHAALADPLDDVVREVLLRRRRLHLAHAVLTRFPRPLRAWKAWLQRLAMFVGTPTLATLASHALLPARDGSVFLGRLGTITLVTVTAYVAMVLVSQALADRKPYTLVTVMGLGFFIGLLLLTSAMQVAFRSEDGPASPDAARTLLAMWVLIVVVPFAVTASAALPGGVVLDDARRLLEVRLGQLKRATGNREKRPPLGKLVIWAWITVPVFPFGTRPRPSRRDPLHAEPATPGAHPLGRPGPTAAPGVDARQPCRAGATN